MLPIYQFIQSHETVVIAKQMLYISNTKKISQYENNKRIENNFYKMILRNIILW